MHPFRTPRFSHLLGTIAIAPTVIGLGMAAAMASARPVDQGETATIVVHNSAKPADPKSADQRHLRRRIESAALNVCGGSSGSLAEVNRTVRASACWHDAVTHAEAQIAR